MANSKKQLKIKELGDCDLRSLLVPKIAKCITGTIERQEAPSEGLLADRVQCELQHYLTLLEVASVDAVDALKVSVAFHAIPELYLGYSVIVIWPASKHEPMHRLTVLVDICDIE